MANKTERNDSGALGKRLRRAASKLSQAQRNEDAGVDNGPAKWTAADLKAARLRATARGALTPEQRREVVEKAFPPITRIMAMPWAGVLIEEFVPTEGRRAHTSHPDDEEVSWTANIGD